MKNPEQERLHDASDSARDSSSAPNEEHNAREIALDKTIADSFPASDAPSYDPDPEGAS